MPYSAYTSLSSGSTSQKSREELIEEYYLAGYKQLEICALLYTLHGFKLSVRHLNRLIRSLDIQRNATTEQVIAAIQYELSGSGAYIGCRSMAKRLLSKYNLKCSRAKVSQILRELDPVGVQSRREHKLTRRVYHNGGPNFLIHLDGYDKLKPFGFAIHGGMDGFSRRILWLRVANTNNDPAVVASYFVNYINEIKGVPRCVQMDRGTENVNIENIQKALRWYHNDDMRGDRSVIKSSSHHNQRIERWWLSQRNSGIAFWIDFFKDLCQTGRICTANALHVDCLRFCYMEMIQDELDQISTDWNQHQVRAMRNAECPSGKPDIMFFAPELFGVNDYKFPASMDDVAAAEALVTREPQAKGCSSDFKALCDLLIEQEGKRLPGNAEEGFAMYEWLLFKLADL